MECMTHDMGHNTPFFTVSNLFLFPQSYGISGTSTSFVLQSSIMLFCCVDIGVA